MSDDNPGIYYQFRMLVCPHIRCIYIFVRIIIKMDVDGIPFGLLLRSKIEWK